MQIFDKKNSIREILHKPGQSSFQRYLNLTTGDVSFAKFLFNEFAHLFLGPLPGGLGIFLRQKIYPRLFKSCGKGLNIGRNCIFRHPLKITIGDNVTIDDNCLLDARGTRKKGLILNDEVIINRGTTIQSKSGAIVINKSVSLGGDSYLVSWDGIEIGAGTAIAAGCYISAGNYDTNDLNTPVLKQKAYTNGPIVIGKNVWIATRVTILDGVKIGQDSIISAGSVVSSKIPPGSVAHGNPARVIFTRR